MSPNSRNSRNTRQLSPQQTSTTVDHGSVSDLHPGPSLTQTSLSPARPSNDHNGDFSLSTTETDDPSFASRKSARDEQIALTSDTDIEGNPIGASVQYPHRRQPSIWSTFCSLPSRHSFLQWSRNRVGTSRKVNGARRSKICWYTLLLILTFLAMLGLVQFISLALGAFIAFFPDEMDYVLEHWGEVGQPSEGLAHWPTDFSADVFPVQCHSHNDYWRRVPLYEAISYGCIGVEADVWLFNQELYVGHTTMSLTPNRTLTSLYINPLMGILEKQNPITPFHPERTEINGVFDTRPEQTLILLVDFKTSGPELFPYVQKQLEPMREKGYLTHWNGSAVVPRPITVVASGNAPYDLVSSNETYRDIFFDAPLDNLVIKNPLSSPDSRNQGQGHSVANSSARLPSYSPTNSYYASVDFKKSVGFPLGTQLSARQIDTIRLQIKDAHARGLKVRYWGIPSWPRGLRNHIWHILIREGADMLNVDDLKGATMRDWRKGKGWWY